MAEETGRPGDEPPTVAPFRTAGLIAGTYLVLAGAYILLSSTMAGEASGTVEQLRRIEIIKGLAFVAGSALLLFGLNVAALERVRRNEELNRRMERALRNAERSVLAGTFARTIAHDINNALSVASLSVSALPEEGPLTAAQRQLADEASVALARIGEWNRRFFEIGGRQLLDEVQAIDLASVVEASATLARQHRSLRTAAVDVALPASAPYRGIPSILQRAVLNLMLNAAEAAGPKVRIAVSLAPDVAPGSWRLVVDDDGPGVPPAMRPQILEPFFTTKPTGTGLGLASVVACARFHGGTVEVGASPMGGARFVVRLGLVPEADAAA